MWLAFLALAGLLYLRPTTDVGRIGLQVYVASTKDASMPCGQWLDALREQRDMLGRTGGVCVCDPVFLWDLPQRYLRIYDPVCLCSHWLLRHRQAYKTRYKFLYPGYPQKNTATWSAYV